SFSESSEASKRRRYRKTVSEKTRFGTKRASAPAPTEDKANNEYDSWSESLSESDESMSSYYSDSDQSADNQRPAKGAKNARSVDPPSAKRAKVAPPRPPPKEEGPKKSPIKMTFMKKQHNLQKDVSVAQKLNGGREVEAPPEEEDRLSS
ncbi:unnamed protein product, partial [Oppiella nova]